MISKKIKYLVAILIALTIGVFCFLSCQKSEREFYAANVKKYVMNNIRWPQSCPKCVSTKIKVSVDEFGYIKNVMLLNSSGDIECDYVIEKQFWQLSPLPLPPIAIIFEAVDEGLEFILNRKKECDGSPGDNVIILGNIPA